MSTTAYLSKRVEILIRDCYQPIEKALFILEHREGNFSTKAIIEHKSFLGHIAIALSDPDLGNSLEQLKRGEGHLRQSLIGPFDEALQRKVKELDDLLKDYRKVVLPKKTLSQLASAPSEQQIIAKEAELIAAYTKAVEKVQGEMPSQDWIDGVTSIASLYVTFDDYTRVLDSLCFQAAQIKETENLLKVDVLNLIFNPRTVLNYQGDFQMGDEYNISGQAGAVGPNAHAHDMTFNQLVNHVEKSTDFAQLAKELIKLREAMAQEAKETSHYIAVGEVAKAEEAANNKDSSKLVESLKAAGKWTLEVATKIGTTLATDIIKQSMGMK